MTLLDIERNDTKTLQNSTSLFGSCFNGLFLPLCALDWLYYFVATLPSLSERFKRHAIRGLMNKHFKYRKSDISFMLKLCVSTFTELLSCFSSIFIAKVKAWRKK